MLGRFFRSGTGLLVLTVLVLFLGAGSIVAYQIYGVAHPPRLIDAIQPGDLLLRSDDVAFQSTDGVPLSGWLIHGDRDAPVLILCHDLGESKSVFLNSVVPLQRMGYNLFLFDFRGHGSSGGKGSTLGAEERYDVLGAIDFLRTRRDLSSDRMGIWAVGMGAYAAVLAVAERKEVTALALDSLYPDIPTYLNEALYRGLPPAASRAGRYASFFYGPYFQWKIYRGAAAQAVTTLSDRNLLFIVRGAHPLSVSEGKEMYASVPESAQADKNLLELEGGGTSDLYAEDRRKYEEGLTAFFQSHLRVQPDRPAEAIHLREH